MAKRLAKQPSGESNRSPPAAFSSTEWAKSKQSREVALAAVLRELKWASHKWWRGVAGTESWTRVVPDEDVEKIVGPCRRFGGNHEVRAEVACATVQAIVKGKNLIRTALEWSAPMVGGNGTRNDQVRGTQWRLVIAWTGLETIVGATRNSGRLQRAHLSQFLDACGLPECVAVKPPKRSLTREAKGDIAIGRR